MTRHFVLGLFCVRICTAFLAVGISNTAAQVPGNRAFDHPWDTSKVRGQSRTIDFTTSEGTLESVDISPDGHWVVFDLLGHIYRVPVVGGEAECLTQNSGAALNYHPRYSPDGTKIVFVSDRARGQDNLWLMDADGRNPRPAFLDRGSRIRQPMWMPDGRSIVAVRVFPTVLDWESHRTTLWQFFLDGAKPRELLVSDKSQYYWPSISPDGGHLYFYRSTMTREGDGLTEEQQIQSLELATGKVRDVTEPKRWPLFRAADVVEFGPEVSPDGRWLAFGRRISGGAIEFRGHKYDVRTALWLRNLATGTERVAMDPIESDATQGNAVRHMKAIPGYRWAKDGRSIIIPQAGKIRRLWPQSGQVETIPFVAHVHREISQSVRSQVRITDEPFDVKFLRWPASSPDGRKLVFEAVGRLWVMDLPDGTPKLLISGLSNNFELTPAWSPNGRWIAFATWDDVQRGHLWKVAATGGTPQRLTMEPGEFIYPLWSPDGSSVIFTQGTGATARGETWSDNLLWQIARVPSDGGPVELIAETRRAVQASTGPGGRVYYPERLPPGDLLRAARHGEIPPNRWNFLSVAKESGNPQKLIVLPGDNGVLSPDGQRVAFADRLDLYVSPMPRMKHVAEIAKSDTSVQRLTRQGGLYPHWRDSHTLEFVSGNVYYVYDTSSRQSQMYRIRLQVPRDIPQGSIALSGAQIITLENRQVIEHGTIVVRGARIACVGDCDPSKADRVLDMSGKTIIPGLVDMHAHHLHGIGGGIPQHREESARYLAYGVTTVLDPYAPSDPAFPIAQLIDAGKIVGPRTFSTGDAIAGYGATGDVHSYQDAEDQIHRQVKWGAVSIKDYHQPSRMERQMLGQAARETGVTITAEGEDLFRDVALIIDGHPGWEHNLPYTPLYSDAVKFFVQAGIMYSATLNVSSPQLRGEEYYLARSEVWNDEKEQRFVPWRELAKSRYYMVRPLSEYAFPLLAEGLADIIHAGGRGAAGGHGEWPGLDTHWDLWSGATALTPMEELEVGTWQGASYIGLDQDLGSIKAGKLADLVVLNSNPLIDIRNTRDIKYVLKGGILYDAGSLDELWPEEKPYGSYPWLDKAALQSDTRRLDFWDQR